MTREDEAEIDELVAGFYAAFDNREGRSPDMATLGRLFTPVARITRVSSSTFDTWTFEEFAAPRAAMLTDGTLTDFHEWETGSEMLSGTLIACRRSVYRKAGLLEGKHYEGGGRKLIHLCRTDGTWLISAVLWEDTGD